MWRRIFIALFVISLTVVTSLILLSQGAEEEPVRSEVQGDVDVVVAGLDADELVAQARALLATERPWRAARTLERYLEQTEDPPADHLVLAARAHGGWGGWSEVLTLLEGRSGLESYEDGIGLYLLGRARDESGDPEGAVRAYRAFLAFTPPAGPLEAERSAARLRLALGLIRTGDSAAGRAELDSLGVGGSRWFRILRADALAQRGDIEGVRQAIQGLDEGMVGLWARRALVGAAWRAGDLAGARATANRSRAWARTTATQAEFLLLAGRIAAEMGDVEAGRDAFRGVIARGAGGAAAREAADLLARGPMNPADHLAVARVQVAQGLYEEALDGYRSWIEAKIGSPAERAAVHMEYATALFYSQRFEEVEAALRPIAGQTRARMLLARAEAHRGRVESAVRIYRAIAREHARSATGREALFLAAGTLHDAGEGDRAAELYRDVIRSYPGSDRMGLALMRLAGMAFQRGAYSDAVRLWDDYRSRYPRGDRALQATYWAGRARAELGDSAGAVALFRSVLRDERDSYYAVLASRRLGVPFWPLPMTATPPAGAGAERRVAEWMRELDLLANAGFGEVASAFAAELAETVGRDTETRYALAEALAARGYSRSAIRIGLSLRGSAPPNRRLLRILHPFPFKTLITEEARDRGLDPSIAAALIRQESMFEVRITSPAGARGLMQIMPATGRRLAEAVGMQHWDPELLYHPEINVHLGIRYVAQHMESYEGSLPSVFSAYNAGTHRVEWWSGFPEYGEDELFTERIPYAETRNYVKILTRNRALYAGLWADEIAGVGVAAP